MKKEIIKGTLTYILLALTTVWVVIFSNNVVENNLRVMLMSLLKFVGISFIFMEILHFHRGWLLIIIGYMGIIFTLIHWFV